MRAVRFGVRWVVRDLRAGELTILIAAVLVAVTAMTAVGFFTDRVGRAIRSQASAVLAADLELRSAAQLDETYAEQARALGLETAESLEFPTMVLADESNSLAYVRAVGGSYPLRGELLVSEELFGATVPADGIPPPGTAWAEPGLLGKMGIEVGDTLQIGAGEVQITRVLEYQPGQTMGGMASLAPGLMVNLADLPRFDVVRPGSRLTYRQLFAGREADVGALRRAITPDLPEGVRLRGLEDAGEQITAAIDRARRFLTLASLVTVILAAVATAMAARRYALRHLDTVALMKSLGATQGFIQMAMLTQLAAVIAGTTVVGSLAGYAGQAVLVGLASDFLKVDLPPPAWAAGSLGLLTAATVTLGFALPHLVQLKTTAPMRVLRHDLPPPALRTGLTYGIAVGALFAMIWAIVRDLLLVLLIAAGLAAVATASVLAGWLLVRLLTQFRGAAGVSWRYGLANISRRGAESVVQIVAFALSLMVLLLLTVVRTDLLDEWKATIPADAPNYFLINIEPDDWPGIRDFFAEASGETPRFLPFLRGRITHVRGESVDEAEFPDPRGANFVRGETNFTWVARFPESNELRAGQWWDPDYAGEIQVSLEESIARSLGVGVGDTLSFNVGGETFTAPVTSLRFVQWDSLQPNFYVMLSPGRAEALPQTYISSLYLPAEQRRLLNRFVRDYPGVTVLDLEVILGQVRMVIDRASMAVQYVFLFTLLAGIIVLLAAIQVTRDERRFESAILHTLGARRRTILRGLAVEFTALGGLAGLLAAIGATGVGWVLAERVFELGYRFDPWVWVVGLAAGGLIVGVTGTLATRRAVNEPPVAVLREA